MKLPLALLLSFMFILSAFSQEEDIKGVYYDTDKTSKIKIFKATNGKYYGKIIWLDTPDATDENNPDPLKRNEPLMGLLFIKGFTFNSNKEQWGGGTIYDPENGKTYDCYMWFEDGNKKILHVKGYVMGMKFAGREVEWSRVK